MDKEAEGFLFLGSKKPMTKNLRWSIAGKVCSPRPMNYSALERAMRRAWGLDREAQFRNMRDNIFVVHFGSEGDWKQSMFSGPWQFDFNVVIIKEYEGDVRPSEMIFDSVDI